MALSGDYTVGADVLSTNITGLQSNTTYAIKVRTVNEDNEVSVGNRVLVTKTAQESGAPTDPANVQVNTIYPTTNYEVRLVWDPAAVLGVISSYEITWDPPYGGTQPFVVADAATYATIPDLYPNARYTFKIKTVAETGGETGYSPGLASVVAATASNVGPTDPTNFSTDPGYPPSDTAVGLSWSGANTLGGATLSGYYISWQPPDGAGYVTAGQYDVGKIVSGLSPATTYSFNIAAVDTSGNDSPGNYYVSATTTDIGGLRAPTNFRSVGTPGITSIAMAWTPAIASLPDVVTCNVIMAFDISEDYELPPQTTAGGSTSNYTFTDLSSNTLYRFSIEAFSETGSALGTNTFEQTTSQPNAPFDPSLSVTAAGYNYVSFEWTLSGDGTNGGSDLSDFYIDYFATPSGTTLRRTISGGDTASNTTVFGLTPNTEYSFTIYARNLSGISSPGGSDATEVVSTATVGSPLAPAGLQPHPYIPATSNSFSVMWNSAYKGSPANAEVTNHIVRISPGTSGGQTTFDVGEDTTITITGIPDPEVPYNVWVKAINASGAPGNECSPIRIVLPLGNTEPGDVGGLRFNGIISDSNIPIAWASSADEQGGADISGYRIIYEAR